jgi:2-dehydro-3-deoxyphosphogluconate aldolase/(4S)-4-hydroxy-2-oxoglutarate aldolase
MEAELPVIELVFRRYSDSKAIRGIATEFPDFWIGASGILNKDQLLRTMDSHARFAISPGVNLDTIREASRRNIMFAPGACTPSDIENILLNGSVDFQFFPAEQSGGVERLKAIIEPFEHLPLDIFAKGGISKEKINDYLDIPHVAAVSVDWILKEEYIKNKDWKKITELALEAKKIANKE